MRKLVYFDFFFFKSKHSDFLRMIVTLNGQIVFFSIKMNITYNTVYIIQQAHCQDVPIRGSINLQCDMFFLQLWVKFRTLIVIIQPKSPL